MFSLVDRVVLGNSDAGGWAILSYEREWPAEYLVARVLLSRMQLALMLTRAIDLVGTTGASGVDLFDSSVGPA